MARACVQSLALVQAPILAFTFQATAFELIVAPVACISIPKQLLDSLSSSWFCGVPAHNFACSRAAPRYGVACCTFALHAFIYSALW